MSTPVYRKTFSVNKVSLFVTCHWKYVWHHDEEKAFQFQIWLRDSASRRKFVKIWLYMTSPFKYRTGEKIFVTVLKKLRNWELIYMLFANLGYPICYSCLYNFAKRRLMFAQLKLWRNSRHSSLYVLHSNLGFLCFCNFRITALHFFS